ncbi:MAG: hypothetical protein QOC92_2808 [Acidimicrobiaceae bacterium]
MDIVVRASAIFFMLWLVTRGMGKRELAQMSPFELILLVTMGDLIQQGVTHNDRSITGAVLAVITITFWVLLFSIITHRSAAVQGVFEGVPVVILRDGRPIDEVLDLERITADEVAGEARSQGIGDLRDIRIGVLEPDGTFSFILHDGPSSQQRRPRGKVAT